MANSSNWLIYLRISEGRQLGYRILRRKSKFEGRRWEQTKVFRVTEKGKRNERGVLFLPIPWGSERMPETCGPIRNRKISKQSVNKVAEINRCQDPVIDISNVPDGYVWTYPG